MKEWGWGVCPWGGQASIRRGRAEGREEVEPGADTETPYPDACRPFCPSTLILTSPEGHQTQESVRR